MEAGFERWLRLGLGRAVLWLERNGDEEVEEILRAACRRNDAWDWQSEGSRGDYVYELVRRTVEPGKYAEEVRAALRAGAETEQHQHFLTRLAVCLADDGNRPLRDLLYARLREPHEWWNRTADAIAMLDGVAGVARVVRERPAGAAAGRWGHLAAIADSGEDVWTAAEREELAAARAADAAVDALLREIEVEARKEPNGGRDEFATDAPYADVRPWLDRDDADRAFSLRMWGRKAGDDEVRAAAEDLLRRGAHEHRAIANGLALFGRRPFPLDPTRLLDWFGDDEATARPPARDAPAKARIPILAGNALANVRDPRVRGESLRRLASGGPLGPAVRLLRANREPGDLAHLIEPSRRALPPEDFHEIALAWFVLDGNREETIALALRLYETNPCGFCRSDIVRGLDEAGALPPELLRECRCDSYDETREWAASKLAAGE